MKWISIAYRAVAAATFGIVFSGLALAFPVTIAPNDGTVHIFPDPLAELTGLYTASILLPTGYIGPGGLGDVYKFAVTGASPYNPIVQVGVFPIFAPPGVVNLTFTWINATTNEQLNQLVYTDNVSDPVNIAHNKLFQLLPANGFYNLVVTGFAFGGEFGQPRYDLNINGGCGDLCFEPPPQATPLPATLSLFAVGLGLLGFTARRGKRKALAA